MSRDKWPSRSAFILAAIGSAVGLGNAWRFPGLAAKHGGGAFLLAYVLIIFLVGIPLLMMEVSIGRRARQAAPGSMRAIGRRNEHIGWMSVFNGATIQIYYAVVFAWVILMFLMSWKFAGLDTEGASQLWMTTIKTTGTTAGYTTIAWPVVGCLIIAWGAAYYCIRNGTSSVSKVISYIVALPVVCLLVLAVRGLTMEGAMAGIQKLFIPDWAALADSTLWVDAIGQVFYSMSVAMAIMFAYGSFLDKGSNIAVDGLIIAGADFLVSVLSSVVMFTTMAGTGMLDNMTASGISTAFIVYPQAIVSLTNIGWFNAIFAAVFYLCLITLALDSLFSITEGVSQAIADKFHLQKKKTTQTMCIISFVIGLFFTTGAGLAWLDIVDNFVNSFALILTGALEAIAIGWCFKTSKVIEEVNRNTKNWKMPAWWMNISIKFLAPVLLLGLFIWNLVSLFQNGGIYGAADGYSLSSNIIGGWLIVGLILISGSIISMVAKKKGIKDDYVPWDELPLE